MDVKGTAVVARRTYLVATFGEDAWDTFFDAWRQDEAAFRSGIISVSTVPVAAFLRFNEAVVEHFYAGDVSAHWRFGQASADWALRQGPYQSFLASRDTERFLRTSPTLWKAYYSAGSFRCQWDPQRRVVEAYVEVPVRHVHFELNVMGYLTRALELTGVTIAEQHVVEGFTQGDARVHYRLELAPA